MNAADQPLQRDDIRLPSPVELAIVVPTYNEAANVAAILAAVQEALSGIAWELIFVDDDSPDGTAERARALARADARVRVVQRIGRRGLASACIEGMLATSAPYLAVMDADLQHDEALLPRMLERLKNQELDIVVGSRYATGGGLGDWNQRRASMSRLATRIGRRFLKVELRDPMSGFFMLRATLLHRCVRRLSGVGFKLLLDIFASHPHPPRFEELPYQFRSRRAGDSKLDRAVAWEYLLMLMQKLTGSMIPARFIGFSLIGATGVVVHMIVLSVLFKGLALSFLTSQAGATLIAMTSNFFLNNLLTYRDMRLRGRALWRGWLAFVAACGIGAIANVGVAGYLFTAQSPWILSALAGILVGVVWNYAVTAVYTWKQPSPGVS